MWTGRRCVKLVVVGAAFLGLLPGCGGSAAVPRWGSADDGFVQAAAKDMGSIPPDWEARLRPRKRATSGFILNIPGSHGITITRGSKVAGMTVGTRFTIALIMDDYTWLASEEGAFLKDDDGRYWVSRRVEVDGKEVIAFFPLAGTRGEEQR